MAKKGITIHKPQSREEFKKLNNELKSRRFIAIDTLKSDFVRNVTLGRDASLGQADDVATCIDSGAWSNGPLSKVAWSFDAKNDTVVEVKDSEGKALGLGYVKWGASNNIPSTIPELAQASPYTAAPLGYIADLTAGLGVKLMYRFADGSMCEFKNAGDILAKEIERLEQIEPVSADNIVNELLSDGDSGRGKKKESMVLQRAREAYDKWERTWLGYYEVGEDADDEDADDEDADDKVRIPGAKDFLEENNLNIHIAQCEQDDVMFDMYFPTVGFNNRGRRGNWNPRITKIGMLPAHSTRLERMNEYRHINHVYFSDQWRTLGASSRIDAADRQKIVMYPAAMPQHLLRDLRYIVKDNQRTRMAARPMWVACPTFYPSLNKPYYPQPVWWSVFTSKAYDFSSTILYDKAKQRENKTSWGRIFYISLDYLDQVFADKGYQGNEEEQQKFIEGLEKSMEQFLQHRENHGKMMRQWMWLGQDGKQHHNVEIVDISDAKQDESTAGKTELELSTSPIFLALRVDPRLVGVPMVSASNGGTALREMALLKQQQLNPKQRIYLDFLNTVPRFNKWDEHAEFIIRQQTFTTLDNSKSGVVETTAGEGA